MSLTTRETGPQTSAEKLSTQPVAPGPAPARRLGPVAGARRLWRQLTSMRTALMLLVLLALAAVPGSLLPQQANAPARVATYKLTHKTLGPIFDRLGLFSAFHAPWFAAIYALLFISLIGCVIPRTRVHGRALLRRPPAAPARLGRLPQSATWHTDLPPEQALAAARRLLRRSRFRAIVDGNALSAEKGYLRETGNLLFHLSLIGLLAAIGIGSLFGYAGTVLVVQGGRGFTNAAADFDTYKPGAFTSPSDLSPFTVTLNRFAATYEPTGQPKTFDAYVDTSTASGVTSTKDMQVNHPVAFGNAKVYLLGHGYAVHVVVRNAAGRDVYDDEVPCIPQDLTDYLSTCVVKVHDTQATTASSFTDPRTGKRYTTNADGSPLSQQLQYGMTFDFVPTAAADPTAGVVSTFPAPKNPKIVLTGLWAGNLGEDSGIPQSVYVLKTGAMTALKVTSADAVTTPGSGTAIPLSQGYTMQVEGYQQWASLQVKDDPAKGLALVAAALIVLGLLLSLRVRRRRLWLRATPGEPGRTLIAVGGLARTDADDFAKEFRSLVGRMAQVLPPAADPIPPPPAADTTQERGA